MLDRSAAIGARLLASRKGAAPYSEGLEALEAEVVAILAELDLPARRSRWAVNDEEGMYVELQADEVAPPGWHELRFCPGIFDAFTRGDAYAPLEAHIGQSLYQILNQVEDIKGALKYNEGWRTAQLAQELEFTLGGFSQISLHHDEWVGRKCRKAASTGAAEAKGGIRAEVRRQQHASWRAEFESRRQRSPARSVSAIAVDIAKKHGAKARTVAAVLYGERGTQK